jgi:hypothetical protein
MEGTETVVPAKAGTHHSLVIPAKAGIQGSRIRVATSKADALDSRLRGNDGESR